MDSVLRPRDIQARIRAGESPETVAAAAGSTVEKIMGFAAPALAERAHIADQALRSSVRRGTGEGASRQLYDAVAERLDPQTVAWDAWRREDGKWVVIAEYGAGAASEQAQFLFDAAGRYVVADDDESRRLVGERVAGEPQLELGDDAIEVVTGRPPARLRSVPTQPTPTQPEASEPSDWMVTQASERPDPPPVDEVDEVAEAAEAADAPDEEPAGEPVDALFDTVGMQEPTDAKATTDSPKAAPEPAKQTTRRPRGRASVPSWDEIMFGSTGTKD